MTRQLRELPSPEFLRERLEYRDGALYWRLRPRSDFPSRRSANSWNAHYPGMRAGSPMKNGYRMVALVDTKFLEHRIIYHMMVEPLSGVQRVDHIDQDFTNNRAWNLRACSHAENLMNQPGRPRVYAPLPKHVYWSKREKKYKVSLRANGHRHYLGTFDSLADATLAAEAARVRLHGRFADSRSAI